MTAKDLKAALLQEAVQGKLVPQIASEGNAYDLLEEIRSETLEARNKTLDARRKTLGAKAEPSLRRAKATKQSHQQSDENCHADSELLRNSIKSKKAGFCVAKSNPCDNSSKAAQ